MIRTNQEYYDAPKIEFPIDYKDAHIKDLEAKCVSCKRQTFGLRGVLKYNRSCLEIDGAVVCFKCKLIMPLRYRYYNHKRAMINIKGKWVTINKPFKLPLYKKIFYILRKIFYILK